MAPLLRSVLERQQRAYDASGSIIGSDCLRGEPRVVHDFAANEHDRSRDLGDVQAPGAGCRSQSRADEISLGSAGSVEVKADGSVWVTTKGKTAQGARVDKNMLVSTDNTGSLSVLKDGTIAVTPANGSVKISFDDKDDLVASSGAKIMIDDKGVVDLLKADGTHDKTPPTITGFKPEARRLAALAILMTEMPTKHETGDASGFKAGACEALGGKCVNPTVAVSCASVPQNACEEGQICCVLTKSH